MAFNITTFRTRALTAIVFVAVMAAGLLWNRWSFFILFSIIHFGAWLEYQRILHKIDKDYQVVSNFHRYGVMLAGWCLMLYFTNSELRLSDFFLNQAGWWIGLPLAILIPLADLLSKKPALIKNLALSAGGLIYISLPLALLTDLRNHWVEDNYQLSLTIPLAIIFSIWINDTMAYLVGSFIGKTQLSPISPKKTWEGTIGGIVLTILFMVLIAYLTGRLSMLNAAMIAFISSVAGTYGDLFESKLKRMANIKDSGSFMPGHGGFLDRFDSLLFAAVAVWFYASIAFAS